MADQSHQWEIAVERTEEGGWYAAAFAAGEQIGELLVQADGRISNIEVAPAAQRQGVATALYRRLAADVKLLHDWDRISDEGLAWLESVEPEQVQLFREWRAAHQDAERAGERAFPSFARWLRSRR